MLLQLVGRDVESLRQLLCGNQSLTLVARLVEEVSEQGLEHGETLGHDRPRDALELVLVGGLRFCGQLGWRPGVSVPDKPQRSGHLAPELGGGDGRRASVLAEDPRRELAEIRVFGHEDAVVDAPVVAIRTLDPPGRIAPDLDLRLAREVANLPGRPVAVRLDIEIRRQPEVALPAGREADVAADARDAEGTDVLADEILADDVPRSVVLKERVRAHLPFVIGITADRPV